MLNVFLNMVLFVYTSLKGIFPDQSTKNVSVLWSYNFFIFITIDFIEMAFLG